MAGWETAAKVAIYGVIPIILVEDDFVQLTVF